MAESVVGGIDKLGFYTISSGDVGTHLFTAEQIENIAAPTGSIKSGSLEQTITVIDDSEAFTSFISDYAANNIPAQVTATTIDGEEVTSTSAPTVGTKMLALYFQNSLGGKKKCTALVCYVAGGGGGISANTWVTNEITITGAKPDASISISALPTEIDPGGLSYTSGDIAISTSEIGKIIHVANA